MTATLIKSTDAWLDFRDDWDELVAGSSTPSVFMTFDYLWFAFRTFHEIDSDLFLIVVRNREGELIGVAPFRRTRRRHYGLALRALEYVTTWEIDKPHVICRRGFERECWSELREFLERHSSAWDLLDLVEMPVDSASARTIPGLFLAPTYRVMADPGPDGPVVDLTQSWVQFLAAHPKYARGLAKLGSLRGGYEVRTYDTRESLEAGIAEYLELERASWKDGKHGLRKNPLHDRFYGQVLRAPSKWRQASIRILASGRNLLAGVICWEFMDTVYVHHTVFNPRFTAYSPGTMLMGLSLGQYMDGGRFRCADLLCGFADFYRPWASRVVTTSHLQVYRLSPKVRCVLWLEQRRGRLRSGLDAA